MTRIQSILVTALLASAALATGLLVSRALLLRTDNAPALAQGTLLDPPRPMPQLSLIDQHGDAFDSRRFAGRWSMLFFGFTSCPDICPTTMATLAQIRKSLTDLPDAQQPQVVLVSVDPQRDTPQQLAAYVQHFHSSFVGVTGTQQALDAFTRELGVPVAIRQRDGGGYTVDHSATIFLVDPNGALRALFSPPHLPQEIAADYRRIVAAPAT
jgi:protein SCO1